jgi:hypothetical protein
MHLCSNDCDTVKEVFAMHPSHKLLFLRLVTFSAFRGRLSGASFIVSSWSCSKEISSVISETRWSRLSPAHLPLWCLLQRTSQPQTNVQLGHDSGGNWKSSTRSYFVPITNTKGHKVCDSIYYSGDKHYLFPQRNYSEIIKKLFQIIPFQNVTIYKSMSIDGV